MSSARGTSAGSTHSSFSINGLMNAAACLTAQLSSFLAATHDLGFSAIGYTYVLISDLFTAANGVVTKQKLEVAELGKYGIVYYNALFMVVPTSLLCIQSGELVESFEFSGFSDPFFLVQLLLSCVLGFLLVSMVVNIWLGPSLLVCPAGLCF